MTPESETDLVLLVGQIDGKLDLLLEQSTSHAARLSALEKDRMRIAGALASLTASLAWFSRDKLPSITSLFH